MATQPARRGSGMEVDWNKVPDNNTLPAGTYLVRINTMKEEVTSTGKSCWIVEHKILDHKKTKKVTGRTNRTWYVIGSDADPMATQQQTIMDAFGTSQLKKMFKSAGVQLDKSIARTAKMAIGKTLIIVGTIKPGSPPRWNIADYFKVGQREPVIDAVASPLSDEIDDPVGEEGGVDETADGTEDETEETDAAVDGDGDGDAVETSAEDVTEDDPEADPDADPDADPASDAVEDPAEEEEAPPPPPKKKAAAAAPAAAPAKALAASKTPKAIHCGICDKDIPAGEAGKNYRAHVAKCAG